MSFDFYLYRAPADAAPLLEWDENLAENLGSALEVQRKLSSELPDVRWEQHANGSWMGEMLRYDGAFAQITIAETQPCAVHFVVVAALPPELRSIMALLKLTHCCAIESGEMRDPFSAGAAW